LIVLAKPRPLATIRDRKLHFPDIAMTDFNENMIKFRRLGGQVQGKTIRSRT
jgi:hypothetical protein